MEPNNNEPVQKPHGTVTRLIGIQLANGQHVEAPVEIWLAAILQSLPKESLEVICSSVNRMLLNVRYTRLDNGLAILNSRTDGLKMG